MLDLTTQLSRWYNGYITVLTWVIYIYILHWLYMVIYGSKMVSTPLKNISQNGNLPQIGVKLENIGNHHLDVVFLRILYWD